MDNSLVEVLSPSILVFASIGFAILISLPRLRFWLKDEFGKRVSAGGMRTRDFFTFNYYIEVTRFMDVIAGLYLFGALLILLCPVKVFDCQVPLWVPHSIILLATTMMLTRMLSAGYTSFQKAWASSRIINS